MINPHQPADSAQTDTRLQELTSWVHTILARDDLQITVASADASFRRYFRVTADANAASASQTWIVMDAPPSKENMAPYIHIAEMLGAAGINTPRVLAKNLQAGYLLLTDLGSRTYLTDLAESAQANNLYSDALHALIKMQMGCAARVHELPVYDAPTLRREMQLFPDWFMTRHLGLTVTEADMHSLEVAYEVLIHSALAQPQVFVHRDYHSRNLMVPQASSHGVNPGILDFQDAVLGPITYDLVSLLRDCYIEWPLERVHGWVKEYIRAATLAGFDINDHSIGYSQNSAQGQPTEALSSEFLRWFDLMGIQRHLKVMGIFARLWHRDGKRGYLNDIPRTLKYVRQVLPNYPELSPLLQLIEAKILPGLANL